MSNIDRLKKDLVRLVAEGHQLLVRMMFDLYPDEFAKARKQKKEELEEELPKLSCTRFRRHRVRCFMEQEVCHGETAVYPGVQA
jgi:hypothetical protein